MDLAFTGVGGGRTLSGRNAKWVYMSEAGGSGFTHPRDNRAGWAGGPALEFLKPQGSCCLKCVLAVTIQEHSLPSQAQGGQKTGCKMPLRKGEGAWLGSLCSAANCLEARWLE